MQAMWHSYQRRSFPLMGQILLTSYNIEKEVQGVPEICGV